MLRHQSVLAALAVLIALNLFALGTPVHAFEAVPQQSLPDSDCTALDIVFLIDQSKSMEANDSNGVRDDSVRTAINILGDNALYYCPGVQHRIAVLGFGDRSPYYLDDIAVYVEPSVIAPKRDTPEDIQAWIDARQELKGKIPETDDLVATDHISAFLAARDVLDAWSDEPLGDVPRKRAVLLVTDGGPCRLDEGCGQGTFKYGPYMAELVELTDPAKPSFLWRGQTHPQSVHIWMILLNDSTEPGYSYREIEVLIDNWTNIAENHGGAILSLISEDENLDLTTQVYKVLEPMLGSELEPWPCKAPIWVAPYTNDVTIFHIWKQGSDPGVELKDVKVQILIDDPEGGQPTVIEDGQVISGLSKVGIDDYTKDGLNERYVFYRPDPGKYTIQVAGADLCLDLDVRIGKHAIEAEVWSPLDGHFFAESVSEPYYDKLDPQKFAFKFYQRSAEGISESLVEDDDYPLTSSVAVTATKTGQTWVYEPKPDLSRPGWYESTEFIQTPADGLYTWQLLVTTLNPRRNEPPDSQYYDDTPLTVVRRSGSFKVVPVELFHFRIVEPEPGEGLALNRVVGNRQVPEPVRVTVELLNEDDDVLLAQDVLTSPNEAFLVEAFDESGTRLEALELESEAGDSGRFSALVRRDPKGVIDDTGKLTLQVRILPGSYKRQSFAPDPSKLQDAVTIDRYEVLPLGLVIRPPDTPTLYRTGSAGAKELNPFEIAAEIRDVKHDRTVEPQQVLDSDISSIPLMVYAPNGESETVMAERLRSVYRGEAGSKLDEAGRYEIRVNLDSMPLKHGYAWGAPESTAAFKRVELYRFLIAEPKPGDALPLSQVVAGHRVPKPVRVTVDMLDQGGNALRAEEVFVDPQKAFLVTVLDENGTELEKTHLAPDASQPGRFSALLGEDPQGDMDEPGELTLNVSAVESSQQPSAAPEKPVATVTVSRHKVYLVDMVIAPPVESSVHGPRLASVKGELNPIEFTFQIKDVESNQVIEPQEALAQDSSGITVTIVAPDGDSETGSATIGSLVGGTTYQARADTTFSQPGDYEVQVHLDSLALDNRFAWIADEHTISFERADTWQTNPSITRLIAGVLTLILATLVGIIVYQLTGGPRGVLYLLEGSALGLSGADPDSILAGPLRLRCTPRVNRRRSGQLRNLGIKTVRVRRVTPLDPSAKHAVHVTAVGEDNTLLFDEVVDPGTALPFTMVDGAGIDILYQVAKGVRHPAGTDEYHDLTDF